MVYNYWVTVFILLQKGFTYSDIVKLTPDDVSLFLATSAAIAQKEADEQDRQQRLQEQRAQR